MLEGLLLVFTVQSLLYLFLGVFLGIIVGALPGFTATMGTALLLPFTFSLSPSVALGMLGGLFVAAMYADCVPAILINTPGTPAAVATAFDGYPMTMRGQGQAALVGGSFGSFVGALMGGAAFLLLAPPLANFALRFGPPEYFWISVFAITIIGSIAGESVLKGIAGGAIGMLISTIGISSIGAVSRFTFGIPQFIGGVSLVAGLIGIFALPQVLALISRSRTDATIATIAKDKGVALGAVRTILGRPGNLVRSGGIGVAIGIIPGVGPSVASLLAYSEAKRWAKDRAEFGNGSIHGVVASETANSSGAGGSLIPLMALGVPGSSAAAIILGALLVQGIQPGPSLMRDRPELVYGFGWSLIIAGLVTFIIGTFLAQYLVKMISVPLRMLVPIILTLALVGSIAIRNNIFDVYAMVALGVIVYGLNRLGFHAGPIGLGLILGPIVEPAFLQSIALTAASDIPTVFFFRPISLLFIALTLGSLVYAGITNYQSARQQKLGVDPAEGEPGAGPRISESLLIGLVLGGLALVFYFRTGQFVGTADRVLDWLLPLILIGTIALCAVAFLIRAAFRRQGRTLPLVPAIFRGKGGEVTAAIVMMVVAVNLIVRFGFWLSILVMGLSISSFMNYERKVKPLMIGLLAIAAVVLTLQYVMWNIFYIPVPETFFLR